MRSLISVYFFAEDLNLNKFHNLNYMWELSLSKDKEMCAFSIAIPSVNNVWWRRHQHVGTWPKVSISWFYKLKHVFVHLGAGWSWCRLYPMSSYFACFFINLDLLNNSASIHFWFNIRVMLCKKKDVLWLTLFSTIPNAT